MARKKPKCCCAGVGCLGVLLAGALILGTVFTTQLLPVPAGPTKFIRFERRTSLNAALGRLESEKIIKDARAMGLYARIKGQSIPVKSGTYELKPGMTADAVLDTLKKPYRQLVRLPEGWWVARTAGRLQEKSVCDPKEYVRASGLAGLLKELEIPAEAKTLEGFLYPDTYDLPPLTPAEDIVRMQLLTFKKRVLPALPAKADLYRAVVIASMVEAEAAKDSERAKIAGVIENRLAKGMPLEIDATVLYSLQQWKELAPGTVRTVNSPYNTYLHKGLPPGPIGSPGIKSIEAALHPEKHGFLYYVARPDKTHYFASTYDQHLKNIRLARQERRAAGGP